MRWVTDGMAVTRHRSNGSIDVRRVLAAVALIGALLAPPAAADTLAAAAPDCQFTLGFKTLHDLIPTVVGDCVEDAHANPSNGDVAQMTTHGLLVWRKPDNYTAFTDGFHTWVNGPFGLQMRLN